MIFTCAGERYCIVCGLFGGTYLTKWSEAEGFWNIVHGPYEEEPWTKN